MFSLIFLRLPPDFSFRSSEQRMASFDGRENLLELHHQVIEKSFGYWIKKGCSS
jgi:hypothetical protein